MWCLSCRVYAARRSGSYALSPGRILHVGCAEEPALEVPLGCHRGLRKLFGGEESDYQGHCAHSSAL